MRLANDAPTDFPRDGQWHLEFTQWEFQDPSQ